MDSATEWRESKKRLSRKLLPTCVFYRCRATSQEGPVILLVRLILPYQQWWKCTGAICQKDNKSCKTGLCTSMFVGGRLHDITCWPSSAIQGNQSNSMFWPTPIIHKLERRNVPKTTKQRKPGGGLSLSGRAGLAGELGLPRTSGIGSVPESACDKHRIT